MKGEEWGWEEKEEGKKQHSVLGEAIATERKNKPWAMPGLAAVPVLVNDCWRCIACSSV